MAEEQQKAVDRKLTELLRQDNVKLWQPPFVCEATGERSIPEEFAEKYASRSCLSAATVRDGLTRLQRHAILKLESNRKYRETGTATLKLRIVDLDHLDQKVEPIPVETSLSISGSNLKHLVSPIVSKPVSHFRLIAGAAVLDDAKLLEEQSVAHQSEVLAILLSAAELASEEQKAWTENLSKSRDAFSRIAVKGFGDEENNHQVIIADQNGKSLSLPDHERKALALAMTLHEKGRTAVKQKEYGRALVFLLDADKEFQYVYIYNNILKRVNCRSEILDCVDNYAILSLDVVWCYLCMRNINSLPDAEKRLCICESGFHRSYGRNLERLASVKHTTAEEFALLIRLHVLQAALAFYQGDYDAARSLLAQSEKEMKDLEVDDEKLSQVMSLGYSAAEARLALRTTRGSVDLAVNMIALRHEEAEKQRLQERRDFKRKRLEQKLGKTRNGIPVNAATFKLFTEMGFASDAVINALRDADNNQEAALAILMLPKMDSSVAESTSSTESSNLRNGLNIPDELLAQLANFGIDVDRVAALFAQHRGNIKAVLNDLVGVSQAEELLQAYSSLLPGLDEQSFTPVHSTSTTEKSNVADNSAAMTAIPSAGSTTEHEEEEAAWQELQKDVSQTAATDYLDVTFDEEAAILNELKLLLAAMQ